ncbi:MAG: hypothetical protein JWQ05_3080 [Methylobacterium sp.]|nr:hypothetical protein [Methylobacterium sp.]
MPVRAKEVGHAEAESFFGRSEGHGKRSSVARGPLGHLSARRERAEGHPAADHRTRLHGSEQIQDAPAPLGQGKVAHRDHHWRGKDGAAIALRSRSTGENVRHGRPAPCGGPSRDAEPSVLPRAVAEGSFVRSRQGKRSSELRSLARCGRRKPPTGPARGRRPWWWRRHVPRSRSIARSTGCCARSPRPRSRRAACCPTCPA